MAMFELRLHGRGGQGVVTAAETLSIAAFLQGRHAQAFPSFGSERTGAPVVSFCRMDDHPIRLREPILEPDGVIVQDPTLLAAVQVFQGLKPKGYVLINTGKSLADLGLAEALGGLPEGHVRLVPATELAMRHIGRPLPNTALLAAFAAVTGLLEFGSVETAIRQKFQGAIGDANVAAAKDAFEAARAAA